MKLLNTFKLWCHTHTNFTIQRKELQRVCLRGRGVVMNLLMEKRGWSFPIFCFATILTTPHPHFFEEMIKRGRGCMFRCLFQVRLSKGYKGVSKRLRQTCAGLELLVWARAPHSGQKQKERKKTLLRYFFSLLTELGGGSLSKKRESTKGMFHA